MRQLLFSFLLLIATSTALTSTVMAFQNSKSAPAKGGAVQRGVIAASDVRQALQNSKQGDKLDYSGFTIQGPLDLLEIPEVSGTTGGERVVMASLDFRDAVFLGKINTWDQNKNLEGQAKVRFAAEVDFSGAQFQEDVNLDAAIFQEDAYFSSHFHRMGSFTEATFEKAAEFHSAQFDGRALFRLVKFQGKANFAMTMFKWIAFFDYVTFAPGYTADFLYARFNDQTIFTKTEFKGIARFQGTQFGGPTSFTGAKFHDQLWFVNGARFDSTLTFRHVEFFLTGPFRSEKGERAPVIFNGVTFSGEANFANSKFKQVDFGPIDWLPVEMGINTVFRQRADFSNTTFEKLGLGRVSFQGEADFSNADLGTEVDLTEIDIGRASMRLHWSQLVDEDSNPKFRWRVDEHISPQARQSARSDQIVFLSSLEAAFQKAGELTDAGEVHYLTENLKRQEHPVVACWLDAIFLKGIYGYGVRPSHQLWTAVVLITLFASAYMKRGALRRDQTQSRAFRLRLADIPVDWSNSGSSLARRTRLSLIRRFLCGLDFSSYVFIKIGFGGIVAGRTFALLVILEWFLGLVVWVLLLINLSNRWPLLHKLVSLIF